MRVWEDKAYLFVGTLTLCVFDLVTEQWSLLRTTIQRGQPWPYSPIGPLGSYSTTVLDHKLYVFSGEDGQNIFMALDLLTNKWEHLSGTSDHHPNLSSPISRKIYIMYGCANRTQAALNQEPGGGENDYTYDDFWSYHVDNKKWTRERLRGSYPSSRTETACAFSDAMGRAVVYGGYHGSMSMIEMSLDNTRRLHTYAYFGDTFVYNPDTNIWQHVLVRGFPSYRATATLVSDPDTGKLYLYGGYNNSDYVPANHVSGRAYNDVWTLKLDLPGGHWNPEDLSRDLRAEKMGPWMRCFTCGNCGVTWQKCAGACGGKYYFCSKDCHRAGWKEHKEKHGCRKL
ncbi:hypothetical protein BDP27DRAFT_1484114 [Rhodocollybia butyracea]|uniref:Galactose oxidase n=1 Tax=Rhodocollybia butyracea TaxID=206335 RepID=A0A9P5U218_9AGAR|nr:hypothetical protein BDP27DRAFT_1484114 [Rhodocollybia butyracea]